MCANNNLHQRRKALYAYRVYAKAVYLSRAGTEKRGAAFDGGTITSDAGALLLREFDLANCIIEQFASCFIDQRDPAYLEHSVKDLLSQRVIGLCLGYEDTVDNNELRKDTLIAAVCGKFDPTGSARRHERDKDIALAGKSILNRLETFAVRFMNPR